MYSAKFGHEELYTRISQHLKYDKLPASLSKHIEETLELEERQIRESLALIGGSANLRVFTSQIDFLLTISMSVQQQHLQKQHRRNWRQGSAHMMMTMTMTMQKRQGQRRPKRTKLLHTDMGCYYCCCDIVDMFV